MPQYKRESTQGFFRRGESRLRLGANIASAWGIVVGEDIEITGFFREIDELLCVPSDVVLGNGQSPFSEVLTLDSAHDGDEVEIVALAQVPASKLLVASDRLIRFPLKWAQGGQQFDLQFKRDAATRLGRSDTQTSVHVITWKGWLVVMSEARYAHHLNQTW